MAELWTTERDAPCDPIDLVEELAGAHEWPGERRSETEIAVRLGGRWCDLNLWFSWTPENRSLFAACALDMRVPQPRRGAVYPLLAGINERLWLGHFELWSDEGWPTFRHTVLGGGDRPVALDVLESVIDAARAECDRYYPAFQLVLWAGEDAERAITAALMEPKGHA